MRLVWAQGRDEEGAIQFSSAIYDETLDAVEHEGIRYGFINFHPITDDRMSIAMREPVSQIDPNSRVLVAECTNDTFVVIGETEGFDLTDKARFLEMLEQKPVPRTGRKSHPEDALSIGEIVKERTESGVVKYLSLKDYYDNFASDEPKNTRFYASNIENHTRVEGISGLVMLEVPRDQECLREDAINKSFEKRHAESQVNPGYDVDFGWTQAEIHGIPGQKIQIMKDRCKAEGIPFRMELRGFDNNRFLKKRREAGYYNGDGEFQTVREHIADAPKPTGVGRFLNMAKMFQKAPEHTEFPHGDLACEQIRQNRFPKKEFGSESFSP